MLLDVILSLILGFLCCKIIGFRLGGPGCCLITVWCIYLSTLFSEIIWFNTFFFEKTFKLNLGNWLLFDNSHVTWNFCYDNLTSSMLLVVSIISFCVHLYSIDYMGLDPHLARFVSYLSLFTIFMLFLITANNFLIMFIGWEGVGLCSFLLINFWHTRLQANKSAIKAVLLNRVGDYFLLIAMFLIFYALNTLEYDIIFNEVILLKNQVYNINDFIFFNYLDLICLCLFLGAVGKSAQLGLHSWLPDAMEGPTPVSALIHAATMVTAGVFLLIRCSFLFEHSPNILLLISIIGVLTAIFAASIGLFQNDIKRVIAYSTCSQLGYMVFICGLSGYQVGFFHLSNHAFFKALLFLGAGSVIHAISDEQDVRRMGGFKNLLPFSYSIFLIGSLALIGFPYLSGFYSKDIILEIAYAHYNKIGFITFVLGTIAALFTAFYSTRLLYLVFLSNTRLQKVLVINIHESNSQIFIPLLLLSIFSIFIGFMLSDIILGFGTNCWNNVILIIPENYFMYDLEFIFDYKNIVLCSVLIGIFICIYFYRFNNEVKWFFKRLFNNKYYLIYFFLLKKWYFDRFLNQIVAQNIVKSGYTYAYTLIDRGYIEVFGPSYIKKILNFNMQIISYFQSGFIYHYVNFFVVSIYLILFCCVFLNIITLKLSFIFIVVTLLISLEK